MMITRRLSPSRVKTVAPAFASRLRSLFCAVLAGRDRVAGVLHPLARGLQALDFVLGLVAQLADAPCDRGRVALARPEVLTARSEIGEAGRTEPHVDGLRLAALVALRQLAPQRCNGLVE